MEWKCIGQQLFPPYPPALALAYAKWAHEGLDLRAVAIGTGEPVPFADRAFDCDRPFCAVGEACPVGYQPTSDVLDALSGQPKRANFVPGWNSPMAARAHFDPINEWEATIQGLVTIGIGAARGLKPDEHVQWVLKQEHPFKLKAVALEPSLDYTIKWVIDNNAAKVDYIRLTKLAYWQHRAKAL